MSNNSNMPAVVLREDNTIGSLCINSSLAQVSEFATEICFVFCLEELLSLRAVSALLSANATPALQRAVLTVSRVGLSQLAPYVLF